LGELLEQHGAGVVEVLVGDAVDLRVGQVVRVPDRVVGGEVVRRGHAGEVGPVEVVVGGVDAEAGEGAPHAVVVGEVDHPAEVDEHRVDAGPGHGDGGHGPARYRRRRAVGTPAAPGRAPTAGGR